MVIIGSILVVIAMMFCTLLLMKLKNREKSKKETASQIVELSALSQEQVDSNVYPNIQSQLHYISVRDQNQTPASIYFNEVLRGEPEKINLHANLKDQVKSLPYNPKREINRNSFEIGEEIGSGNFGMVFKGHIIGLHHPSSRTRVAIKSLLGTARDNEIDDFLVEIKIMSHVNPHLNLVSMIGACTSELAEHGKMWLLLEFCRHGDLRNYVIENKEQILSGKGGSTINDRCLIQWAYHIANGMQYLATNNIMHGDLAARNILMDDGPFGSGCPVAKVSDFGLSKRFYDHVKYQKNSRLLVPWKWMAFEYLTRDIFTLNSDVWSFGVLFWELLSFGSNPYGHQDYDEVLEKLKNGYRLSCPEEISQIISWSPKALYNKISNSCFVTDHLNRASFSNIVGIIEEELLDEELTRYNQLHHLYKTTRTEQYFGHGMRQSI